MKPRVTKEDLRAEHARFSVAALQAQLAIGKVERLRFDPRPDAARLALENLHQKQSAYFQSAAILAGLTAEFLTQDEPVALPIPYRPVAPMDAAQGQQSKT